MPGNIFKVFKLAGRATFAPVHSFAACFKLLRNKAYKACMCYELCSWCTPLPQNRQFCITSWQERGCASFITWLCVIHLTCHGPQSTLEHWWHQLYPNWKQVITVNALQEKSRKQVLIGLKSQRRTFPGSLQTHQRGKHWTKRHRCDFS